MNKSRALIIVGMITAICSCHSLPLASVQPAHLAVSSSAQCYQQLEQSLSSVLNYPVHLTTAAFAQSAVLSLEKAMPRFANSQHKDGMSLALPQTFTLQLIDRQCVVSRSRPKWQATLSDCTCLPLSAQESSLPHVR